MIAIDANHLLMIEPTSQPSVDPIIDDVTRKVAGALLDATRSAHASRGVHSCTGAGCQASSDNTDWYVALTPEPLVNRPATLTTHSLAVHYVAHHRADVPASQIAAIGVLSSSPAEPTPEQLSGRSLGERPRDKVCR